MTKVYQMVNSGVTVFWTNDVPRWHTERALFTEDTKQAIVLWEKVINLVTFQ